MNDLTQNRWQQIDTLFDKALEKSKKERTMFLQEICGSDTELLNHVEKLLQLHEEAQDILGESVTTFAAPLIPGLINQLSGKQPEPSGSMIGSYEILEELGHGGMGSVYLVKKEGAPYEKQVALKLIHKGMDTGDVLRRFRNEGQILASLEHPNIARIYDGGVHTDGRPYFVMERIKGEPIDVYCDKHKLSIKERLQLFRRVCEAVQYAHQNLVVHRDIKPAHVLVTAEGEIKLVDFGIAKLLEPQQMKLSAHQTQTGVRVMTPEFAAPEQVRGEPVTTASDIYSLGILLYLLLTGRRPYHLQTSSMLEIERIVCETEPIRPSEAVTGSVMPGISTKDEILFDTARTAELRGKKLEDLRRELSGDLDQIVLMALRKEPERRFRSALSISEDIGNYLHERPIQARPSTVKYRVKKFVARNRWAVLAVAIAIISVLIGLGFALWQADVARIERDTAQLEAAKARAAQDYLVGLFETADPAENQGEQMTAQQLVQRGISRLEEDLADEPEVHVEMLKVLGRVEMALGDYNLSRELLEDAFVKVREVEGVNSINYATVSGLLGEAVRRLGEYDIADSLIRKAIAIRANHVTGNDAETALYMNRLASIQIFKNNFEEAETLYNEALATRELLFGENSDEVSENLNNIGWLYHQMGNFDDAEASLRKSLKIREQLYESPHPSLASTTNNLAGVLRSKGNLREAETYFKIAYEQELKLHGDDHPRVTTALSNLSLLYLDMARYKEAASQYQQVLANNRRQLGDNHAYVGLALLHLSTALVEDGRMKDAFPLLDEMLKVFRTSIGEDHRYYAKGLMVQAEAFLYSNPERSITILQQATALLEKNGNHEHPDFADVLTHLGRAQFEIDEFEAAESAFRRALNIQRETLPPHHPNISWTLTNLGRLLTEQQQVYESESLLREAVEVSMDVFPDDHWRRISAQLELGACLLAQGLTEEAREVLEQVLAALEGRTDFHAVRLQARAIELISSNGQL